MDDKLDRLAAELADCREKENMRTLKYVLESARILRAARKAARRGFGLWLREKGHMDRATACRHLRVADFIRQNVALTTHLESLSIAKVYALTTLKPKRARAILVGKETFSLPLNEMSDLQFRAEFRKRFPSTRKTPTWWQAFRRARADLSRARISMKELLPFSDEMSRGQKLGMAEEIRLLLQIVSGWSIVA